MTAAEEAAASAGSVGSAAHPPATEAARSFGSAPCPRAGTARGAVRPAAAAVWEAVACATQGRAVEHPYRASQAALGVAAASRARFCLKLRFSAGWVREGQLSA